MHKNQSIVRKEEDILLAVLQLLMNEKTGYELMQLLRGEEFKHSEGDEGSLYTLLHRLEQNRFIQSSWDHAEAKYYQLNDKGNKMLRKAEKNATEGTIYIKRIRTGVRTN